MCNFLKRFIDVIFALPATIVLLPVFIVIWVMIRLGSKGAVVFKQERAGKNGKPFIFYKFRTMRVDVELFGSSPKSALDIYGFKYLLDGSEIEPFEKFFYSMLAIFTIIVMPEFPV